MNVDAGGAQQWGQAQSYALKQFLRASFLIPTGEPDADSDAPFKMENVPAAAAPKRRRGAKDGEAPPVLVETPATSDSEAVLAAAVTTFVNLVGLAKTVEEVDAIKESFRMGPAKKMSMAQQQTAADAYNQRIEELSK